MAKKGGKKNVKTEFQLLKEEEARKALANQAKERAKEKQSIEEKNFRLNHLKIQAKWKEIMKIEKSKLLNHQLAVLEQTHYREVDRQNGIISDLEKNLHESEIQYENALRSHMINIDTIIDLQDSRLSTLQYQFESDTKELETEFETERARLLMMHAKETADIMNIMARMEHDYQETEADAKHEYSSLKDDVKNKNLEEKHALRIQLEGTVEDLWRQFQAALNQYNLSTEERKKQFEDLKLKDQKNAKEIETQMKKLSKFQENIAHSKAKLSNNNKEYEEKNKSLKEEKEAVQVLFQSLKKKMNLFREHEKKKLVELTVCTGKVLKTLEAKVEEAEKIIKLAEMNRKLETESEKILPFYIPPSVVADDAAAAYENEQKVTEGNELEKPMFNQNLDIQSAAGIQIPQEFLPMEQFSKRYNKVLLDRMALEKQRSQLRQENFHLRSILKQYLDGLTVNEEVLSKLNPLLVVNGKTNAPMHHTSGPLNITCVDANQVVASGAVRC